MAPRKLPTTDQTESPVVVTEENVPDVPEIYAPSDNLFSALVKAQLEFTPIIKDKLNPHFKSKYADLDSIMKSIREPLLRHNLVLFSFFEKTEEQMYLVTRITFAPTGESFQIDYPITLPANEQQKGSALTYARRYSICALLNLSADADDDGNAAVAAQAEVQPLAYSKKECLDWAKTHAPYCHSSDDERALKFDAFAKKGHYDTAGKWKMLCWENRDRYNPNKSAASEVTT
ncbi:recombination protein [Pseudanabaena phage PA-SR01]|nr:recombination protein [Pseudanabaena phage PA-SR01]